MLAADLHVHSTASDGCLEPEDIVSQAADAGLQAVAVTDHDTLQGAVRAASSNACARGGVCVVPGVEISTQVDGRTVHMLGYFCDVEDEPLAQLLTRNRRMRRQRTLAMAQRLAADGYPLDVADIASGRAVVNRSLLARLLVDGGAARNTGDAFTRLLGKGAAYYIEVCYADTVEAMRLIRGAGGLPFIAHPAHYGVTDLVARLAKEGLHGVEVYHTLHSEHDRRKLSALAGEQGLAVSGGSDWHGDGTHGARLGGAGLSASGFARFLAACGRS